MSIGCRMVMDDMKQMLDTDDNIYCNLLWNLVLSHAKRTYFQLQSAYIHLNLVHTTLFSHCLAYSQRASIKLRSLHTPPPVVIQK